MGVNQDVMGLVDSVVEDEIVKAKIVKSLLAQSLTNPEVIGLLQEYIESLEQAREEGEKGSAGDEALPEPTEPAHREEGPMDAFERELRFGDENAPEPGPQGREEEGQIEPPELNGETPEGQGDSYLPSPSELNLDLTANQ